MPAVSDSAYLVTAGWDSIPHLDEKVKKELLERTPPYLRDARSKGTPSLGAGAIYPIPESEIVVPMMMIPPFWRKAFTLDVGWNKTACLWGAEDPSTGVCYLYSEYYQGQQPPSIHAAAIKSRGEWIPGAIDPAARGRSQRDGEQLILDYQNHGLNLTIANNAVDAGLYATWEMLATGRLKIMAHLTNTLAEYRLYRRDEHGKIVKKFDHLMDDMRYYVMTGRGIAIPKPFAMKGGPSGGAIGDRGMNY